MFLVDEKWQNSWITSWIINSGNETFCCFDDLLSSIVEKESWFSSALVDLEQQSDFILWVWLEKYLRDVLLCGCSAVVEERKIRDLEFIFSWLGCRNGYYYFMEKEVLIFFLKL